MTHKITRLHEVDSTNLLVLGSFSSFEDREVIVARRQRAGRGRLDRTWWSEAPENLYMTIALEAPVADPRGRKAPVFPNPTQLMAVELCRTLETYGVDSEIKWPNDVLVGSRKIAGILAEGATVGPRLVGVALGVGVNLNMRPGEVAGIDQPATALNLEIGAPVERDRFLEALLDGFFPRYDRFLREGFASIRSEFLARGSFLGKRISIVSGNSRIAGTASDITEDGALLVVTGDGRSTKVTIGDMKCY